MVKAKTIYNCQSCGASHPKWQGQCSQCGEWNTLVEEVLAPTTRGVANRKAFSEAQLKDRLVSWSQVKAKQGDGERISTQIEEFDRVLGGVGGKTGIVPGAVMLLGGEPGIGKSTLLTQVVLNLVRQELSGPIFYVCGEESPQQIDLRINRILIKENKKISKKNLTFITTVDVDELVEIVKTQQPSLVVVDSIQAMTTSDLTGAPGSVSQVREAADRLAKVAKRLHIPMFLIGHVTKDGAIAGPKTLEHIVDAVLELSGERTGELRLLRTLKNRFGATDEVGVFRVDEVGLAQVNNPSEFFLEHAETAVPGSATTCVMEGTRPLLIEVQALVVKSQLAMPRRVGRGIDLSRIQVLAAVLQKHCKQPLGSFDIFLSAAGGYKVTEPGVDLGLAMALVSSLKNKPLPQGSIFIGEVGLLGEIRQVSYLDRRLKEAKRLGFNQIYFKQTHRSVRELLGELKI
ncbi:DNA repair protein RadA [Patescibacteria group bacterium]|nr:DNA repair protein RadA [Patescibacteria group bacterium]